MDNIQCHIKVMLLWNLMSSKRHKNAIFTKTLNVKYLTELLHNWHHWKIVCHNNECKILKYT